MMTLYACSLFRPTINFNAEIRPILNNKCITCHGGVKQNGGFSLLFREEALGITESGKPAIIPGDADASEFIIRLRHHDPELRMPYESDPLSDSEIELLEKWIDQGAEWEDHWAYIAPDSDIQPPSVSGDWARNGIDPFVQKKLHQQELTPSPEAAPEVLIRRLSLDLTGLPPNSEMIDEYLADPSDKAYEKVVDQLLSSPHFGERWAAMWLDLSRYADSRGYEKDLNRSIWKYRDWVIDAFNRDLRFDEFTIEQLAGDLLPNATEENLIATAFHRNTMANDEGGTNDEEYRVAAQIERVGTTWEVWQGTTMACVQCHSHPYDPFRHKDFYRFMAFLNNTEDKDIYNEQPKIFTYPDSVKSEVKSIIDWVQENSAIQSEIPSDAFLYEQRSQLLYKKGFRRVEAEEYQDHSRFIELTTPDQLSIFQIQDSSWIMFEAVDLTNISRIDFRYATPNSGGFIEVFLDSLFGEKIGEIEIKTTGSWKNWQIKSVSISPTDGVHNVYYYFRVNRDYVSDLFRLDWIQYHSENANSSLIQKELEKLYELPATSTPILRDLPSEKSRITRHFNRGNWMTLGDTVQAIVPVSMPPLPDQAPNNRLGMAQWLVSQENPLTARVIVNRFWEQLFGVGIVETAEDFGSQGFAPTHPQLLDWLAVQFMTKHEWSMKSLLKEIVLSATYRQQSETTPELLEKDPYNRLLSRGPRVRLSAEQIRDQAMSVSGLLKVKMYGPPVRFEAPEEKDVYRQGNLLKYDPHRRAIYSFWKRTYPLPFMTAFDGPARNVCTSRRIRTNTPLQALVLLNDSIYFQAAQRLGEWMDSSADSIPDKLTNGYQKVMIRKPSQMKLNALKDLYEETLVFYSQNPNELEALSEYTESMTASTAALTLVANTLLNMDEFITKQ